MSAHRAFLLLLLLSAILFLTAIGSYRQFLRAESPFSLGARMMLETDEFLLPHGPHELPLNKPPLQYWLIGISYKLFGFSYGASRIPSALCGLGVITLVYILGLRLRDNPVGKQLGLSAAAVLATSYLFWAFARLAMPDMLLTLCVSTALGCWMLVLTDQTRRPAALALIGYAAVALGVLTKGPVAIVLALFPVLGELLISRNLTILRRLRPIPGGLVFLFLTAPYFLLVYADDGVEPLRNFFINENWGRFTGATYTHRPGFLFYEVTAFFADLVPWSPLLLITASSPGWWRNADEPRRCQLRILFLWMIAPIVFFSLSHFTLDYYFLPALPPAALFIAQGLLEAGPAPARSRRVRWIGVAIMGLMMILLAIAMVLTIQIVNVNFSEIRLRWLPHAIAVTAFLPVFVFAILGRTHQALLAFAFTLWATACSAYLMFLPSYSRFQPAARLAESVPLASHVYTSSRASEWALDLALHLPTSQPVKPLSGDPENSGLGLVLRADPHAVALVYETDYRRLRQAGLQVRVRAQAEAYKGNRLTLRSLLAPSHETLYLVSATR